MTLSFRARLALEWNIAFSVLLAAASVAIYLGIRTFLQNDLDAALHTLGATEVASAADSPAGLHLHEFPPDAVYPEYNEKFVQLIDPDGSVMMQSPTLRDAASLVSAPDIGEALAGRAPRFAVRVNGRPGRMIALRAEDDQPYVVAVGVFTDRLDATLQSVRRLLAGVWLAAIVVTGIIGHTLASRALRPIARITARASEIAKGRFATQLDTPAVDDEIGRMTRLLNQMLERLFQAIEANRRFAADASHELRSPLTALLGEVDLALKRERSAEEYRETLALARERLQELAALTDDLMLVVRAQEGKPGPVAEVPLQPLLARVAARASEAGAPRSIRVTATVPPDLVVYADERLLERVFDNLARNAVQYNVDGGSVTIAAEHRPRSGEWVADDVIVTVSDTGPGIPASERERVFERFHRLDRSRSRRTGGAGLGLAIAREIAMLHGGSVRVVDRPGPGATFEVRLPGGRPTIEAAEAAGQAGGAR